MTTLRIFLLTPLGIALAAAQAGPVFDVASVKPTATGVRDGLTIQPGGRLLANGFSLKALIAMAYHTSQISCPDGWMANDRWSIEAKAEEVTQIPAWAPPYPPEVMAVRLQSLLEDRFLLKLHREKREMKAYTLTPDKNGGKLIPMELIPMDQSAAGTMAAGPGVIQASAVTMEQFVNYLNRIMDLPVIDQTELAGHYNFKLRFAPESTRPLSAPPPDGSSDPSIIDAIQEQLGLELRAVKRTVEVLVIDSARRPSAN